MNGVIGRMKRWMPRQESLQEYLQNNFADIPLFRYEDFSSAPSCYAPMIFKHCGCAVIPETYEHIKPTSVGRYSASILPSVRTWKFSNEFVAHLRKYGYRIPQLSLLGRASISTRMLKHNTWREISSLRVRIKNGHTKRST